MNDETWSCENDLCGLWNICVWIFCVWTRRSFCYAGREVHGTQSVGARLCSWPFALSTDTDFGLREPIENTRRILSAYSNINKYSVPRLNACFIIAYCLYRTLNAFKKTAAVVLWKTKSKMWTPPAKHVRKDIASVIGFRLMTKILLSTSEKQCSYVWSTAKMKIAFQQTPSSHRDRKWSTKILYSIYSWSKRSAYNAAAADNALCEWARPHLPLKRIIIGITAII